MAYEKCLTIIQEGLAKASPLIQTLGTLNMWRSFKNTKTRPLDRESRYFWKNHSEKRLRLLIRVIGGREIGSRLEGQTYKWRARRKRLVLHYIKNYGAVPAFFLQDRLQSKISASFALAEYKAWAYPTLR